MPTLKKSLKEEPVVTSLFETEAKIEFLIEPESPSDGSDSNWSSYFNKCEKVRRTNLMKQYTFMELFDFQGYWSYRDINYNALAPSKEELLQIIKKGILKYKDKPGRYSDVWFDNDRKAYLDEDIALSDYELYNRVFRAFRFFVMPYTSFGHVSYDASYSASYHNDYTSYRFYFDYGKLNGDSFSSRGTLEFDFFEPKFVQWLREVFKIKQTDYISEEKAMKIGLAHFLDMCNINIEDLKFKDYKDFEDFMLSNMENHNYHGSSCSFLDGYGYNITFQGKKFTFILKHEVKFRNAMNLHIPEEFEDDYDMALCILENKDVLKKIFELLNTPPYRQETLF